MDEAITPGIWTLMVPTNPTEFWTMVLAVLTLALLVVAGRGLRSLRLTKKEMTDRATRQACAKAVRCMEVFALEIVPQNMDLLNLLQENRIEVFTQRFEDVRFDDPSPEYFERAREWSSRLEYDVARPMLALLNRVESWASHFVSGVANADVAFEACAPPFCMLVTQYHALVIVTRRNRGVGVYPNTTKLFNHWRQKIQEPENEMHMQMLEVQIEDLGARMSLRHDLRPPIGTE